MFVALAVLSTFAAGIHSSVPDLTLFENKRSGFNLVDRADPAIIAADTATVLQTVNNSLSTSSTLGLCCHSCVESKDECIGVAWLPLKSIPKGELKGDKDGSCTLLRCVPPISQLMRNATKNVTTDERKSEDKLKSYLYLIVAKKRSLPYGVTSIMPPDYDFNCTEAKKVYNEELSFEAASEVCRKDGGHLALTKTTTQHTILSTSLDRRPYWIGLVVMPKTRTFHWIDGSELSAEPQWGKKQPNNYRDKGQTEQQDCVMLHHGVWNDEQCSKPHAFVCQIIFLER